MREARAFTIWVIAVVVCVAAVLWAAYAARAVLVLVYVSGLLAIGLNPLVRRIESWRVPALRVRGVPRGVAILVIYVGVVAVLGVTIVLILPSVQTQAQELWAALPDMFERAQSRLVSLGLLRQPLTLHEAFSRVPVAGADAIDTIIGAASGIAGGIFGVFTIAILTFYLLLESSGLFESFADLFPASRRKEVRRASTEITGKISAWLIGQLMLMAIIGTSAAVGLGLLGVPYFYVLAVIAGLGELIPVVGPILAAVPAIAVSLNDSFHLAIWVAVFFVVQQQVENHVLVPKVMERQVGVSPVTVIVALLIGGALQGLLGAILAVPTAAILQVVLQHVTAGTVQGSRSV